jgi:hypothetical protein
MAGAGFFETGTDRIQIRVSGHLHSVDDLKKMPLLVGDKTIQLVMLLRSIAALVNLLNHVCVLWVRMGLALRCPCVKVETSLHWAKI